MKFQMTRGSAARLIKNLISVLEHETDPARVIELSMESVDGTGYPRDALRVNGGRLILVRPEHSIDFDEYLFEEEA